MANNQQVVQQGLGLPTVLFLIFLILQLTGNIDWPWYAVASPLLIGWGLLLAFIVVVGICAGITAIIVAIKG